LCGINFLALRPLGEVSWTIRRIGAPPLEHAGVYCLVDIRVRAIGPNVWLLADRAIKRLPRNPAERGKGVAKYLNERGLNIPKALQLAPSIRLNRLKSRWLG
jgi:hypothetical protein